MSSRTTPKTSQDTKEQTSHLQLVLNEVNKLTKNLPESERLERRLQLPYIAMGYFNEKGGSLSLDEYGVHLTIPCDALPPGSVQQVYIYVDPTAPPDDVVDRSEVSLSSIVKCGPTGLFFKESVVLSFPHHAVLISQRYDKVVVRMCHDDSKVKQWEDGNPALVTEKKVFVPVDQFTKFSLIGTPQPGSSKRLKVGAFGGLLDKRRPQYTFRVHVWSDEKNVEKNVVQEEEDMQSKKLDVFRNLEFFLDSGSLALRVLDLERGWEIRGAKEQLIEKCIIEAFPENSVTFTLKRQTTCSDDAGLYCVAQCFPTEDSRNRTGVRMVISPKQKQLSRWEEFVGIVSNIFTTGRQQRPDLNSTEDNKRCECKRIEGASFLCFYCKEQIGNKISTQVHGEVDPRVFGGLSKKAVCALCVHLDCERNGANNWKQLVERMTNLPGRSVQFAVESGKICTKDLLKLYFDVCRDNNKTDNEAIEKLVSLLTELGLYRAAKIIQDDVKKIVINK